MPWDFPMQPKDMPNASYLMLDTRSKPMALHLDPHGFVASLDDEHPPSPSTPGSTIQSPSSPARPRPRSAHGTPDTRGPDTLKVPASGPQRARSTTAGSAKTEKEKRKRSRVNPEQLIHLERFFALDRSPTAARRREISDLLGMQERQTQIWFQNRRAKAKLQDGKNKGRSGSAESPPDSPPELSTGFEVELHNLIHEDEPITIIPCTDLAVGTWRRIATAVGKHDLVAYVCETKQCLTWFIHSDGYGFKMEIPFEIIQETEFTNAAPGSGLASFVLSQPPIFYLENISSPRADGTVVRQWKQSADWTEGQQATKVLRHDLIGSAVQLAHLLRNLRTSHSGPDLRLHSPVYHRRSEPSRPPMELPPPPLTALSGPGFRPRGAAEQSGHNDRTHQRQRSYSGPPAVSHHPSSHSSPDFSSLNVSTDDALSTTFPSSSYTQASDTVQRMQPSPSHYAPGLFPDFTAQQESAGQQQLSLSQPATLDNLGAAEEHVTQAYSDSRAFYDEDARGSPYVMESLRRHSSVPDLSFSHTPSPPILTAYDQRHSTRTRSSQTLDSVGPVIPSL